MLVRAPRTLRGRVGMLRALHARAAYVPRESVRTAYSVREPADTGSNMQLDPRGVDYALFELPSEEYQTPVSTMHVGVSSDDDTLAPPAALLQRLLRSREFGDAMRALSQLESLDTPLGTPIVEYAHAARHCAAHNDTDAALRWLTLVPHAAELGGSTAHDGRWHVDQAMHWLTGSDAGVVQRACILVATKGYISALTTGVTHLYRTGAWRDEGPAALWARTVAGAPFVPVDAQAGDRQLARLYNRAVRAMVHGGAVREAHAWAHARTSTSAAPYALDAATEALLRGTHAVPSAARAPRHYRATMPPAPMQHAVDTRVLDALHAGDLAHARFVLLHAFAAPSVDVLATFLAHAGRNTAIEVPRDARRGRAGGAVATGRFLRPVRTAIERHDRTLYDTALVRARHKERDWHGTLRVFQWRFQPVPGLDPALLQAAEQIPPAAPLAASHAAASHANSDARRADARGRRVRHLASPYVVACVLRALVELCAGDEALLQRLYAHCIRRLPPRHLTVRVFEALIPAWSAAAPHKFVQAPGGALWTMLRDMQRAHIELRAPTWTLLLQALVRDGTHESWALVYALLEHMSAGAAQHGTREAAAVLHGVPVPRATPAMFAGVLQTLHIAPGVRAERARQVRNVLHASPDAELVAAAAAHAPLQAQLSILASTER